MIPSGVMMLDSESAWARGEFGRAALGNSSRTARLVAMAEQAARCPGGTITSVFSTVAAREGAFRLVENEKVSAEAMMVAARQACARRCSSEPFVYVAVDQSSLNLTDDSRMKGFGAVGRGCDSAVGLQVMSGIAVCPDGTPEGLLGQVYWARPRKRGKKRAGDRARLTAAQKETAYWLGVISQTQEALAATCVLTRPWFQLDRGADAWPILSYCASEGLWLTVRAAWDRHLVTAGGEPQKFLWETVTREEPMGDFLLAVPERPGRRERLAVMQLRARPVTLDIRDKRTEKHFPLGLHAVHARELGAPRGEKPLEWMLLTTRSVHDLQDAYEVVFGYSQRWRVEDFHRAWKTGACNVEATQLRSKEHVIRWAVILASVAMRIQRLIHLSRTQPDEPATVEFTQPEIDAVIAAAKPKGYKQGDVPRLVDVVRWIANEGGYTGKSSGGPPGTIVLTRGMERMQLLFRFFTDRAATEKR